MKMFSKLISCGIIGLVCVAFLFIPVREYYVENGARIPFDQWGIDRWNVLPLWQYFGYVPRGGKEMDVMIDWTMLLLEICAIVGAGTIIHWIAQGIAALAGKRKHG